MSLHNIVISFFYTSRCLVLQSHQIMVKQNSPTVTFIQLIAVINVIYNNLKVICYEAIAFQLQKLFRIYKLHSVDLFEGSF